MGDLVFLFIPNICAFGYIFIIYFKTRNLIKRYFADEKAAKLLINRLLVYPLILLSGNLAEIIYKLRFLMTGNSFFFCLINVIFFHAQTLWISMYFCYNSPEEIKLCLKIIFCKNLKSNEVILEKNGVCLNMIST